MDTVFTEPLRLGGNLGRDTNRDDVKGDDVLGDAQKLPQWSDAFLIRVNATPGAAVAEGGGSKEDVLRRRRAVLDPVSGDLLEGGLRAHDDGEARVLGEGGVRVDLGDLGEGGLVTDHNKVPSLRIDGAGGVHPGLDDLTDVLVGDLLGGVKLTGGTTGLDNVVNEIGHDNTKKEE